MPHQVLRTSLIALLAFVLGALAYRAELHYEWLSALGVKSGYARAYAKMLDDRTVVECPSEPVLLILGQSNAANTVRDFLYRPQHRAINFNALDGKCYVAEEPLLGMYEHGQEWRAEDGGIWTMVADGLAAESGQIILAPIAKVGSSVKDWSIGVAHERLMSALDALRRAKLAPSWIVWHQGETDAENGMTGGAYAQHFERVVASLRQAGIDAPIFVALATVCRNFGSEEIRAAQAALPQHLPNVKPGPDADQLSHVGLRYDGCHFSAAGAKRLARLWVEALRAE